MRTILGFISLCGLLSPSQGRKPGAQCVIGPEALNNAFSRIMLRRNLLQRYLGEVALPDVVTEESARPQRSITELRIVNARGQNVSLKLSSNTTQNGFFATLKLDIRGSVFLNGVLCQVDISTEAKLQTVYSLEDYSAGTFQIGFRECVVQLGDVVIKLSAGEFPESMLPTVQDSLLMNLPPKLCPKLQAIFDRAKERLLRTVNVDLPFGHFGSLNYQLMSLPVLTYHGFRINFSTEIVDNSGLVVSIPDNAALVEVPPVQSYKLCLGLQESLLNMVLSFLVQWQPLHLEVSPEMFSGAFELRKAIELLISSTGSGRISDDEFPSTSILYFDVIVVQNPTVVYGFDKALLQLTLQIEGTLLSSDGSLQLILTMKGLLGLDAKHSVSDGKLVTAASLSRLELLLESSQAGISDVSTLVPHCKSLLNETFIPVINAHLHIGLPLPSILNMKLDNSSIQVIQGAVVLCV